MDALAILVGSAYAAAALLYLLYQGKSQVHGSGGLARAARAAVAAGFFFHAADIAARCFAGQHPASSAVEALGFIAWLIAGGYLAASLRYRIDSGGAFAVPATLALYLLARIVPTHAPPDAAAPVALGPLGLLHISLATVGVATFALATVIEALYLVQERRLKRRQLGRAGEGASPLDTLDRLAARCVSFGFPVFTAAVVTGALWVARLGLLRTGGAVRPEYVLAVGSWALFGVLLGARARAGWQGRRAAWLTLSGFTGVLLATFGYLLRAAV